MKLLVFCYEFPPIGAGAGNAVYHLAREWVKLGHEVTVVTSRFENLPREDEKEGIRVIRVPVGRKFPFKGRVREMLLYMVETVLGADKYFRRHRPDLCLVFMTLPGGLAPLCLKMRHGVPFITHIRGGDVPGFDPGSLRFYHFLLKFLIGWMWRKSRAVIANSRGLAKLAEGSVPSVRVLTIPNGVDSSFFMPPENSAKAGKLKILFAGRFVDSQKNISMLLWAASRFPEAELVLVGDGPDKARLAASARRLGLGERVHFPGWLKGEDLLAVYQSADVYVSASRWEGMPNTVLEAMAVGLPLLLSRVAGHEELVEEGRNGFLFDASDERKFLEGMSRLLGDADLWNQMGRAGRAAAVQRHDWARLARAHLEIYRAHV